MATGGRINLKDNRALYNLVNTALFAVLTMLLTIVNAPVLAAGGFIHLGDAAILAACYFIGWFSIPASVIGSTAADMILGAAYYAPATAVIKAIMPLIITALIKLFKLKKGEIGSGRLSVAFLAGSVFMQAAYTAYTFLLPFLGSPDGAALADVFTAVFWINIAIGFIQTAAGLALGLPIIIRLRKINWVKDYFFGGDAAAPLFAEKEEAPVTDGGETGAGRIT